jgi:transposase InsO family protein
LAVVLDRFSRQVVVCAMSSRIDRELAMPKRRHSFSNDMSPVEYEKQYFQRLSSVWKSRGDSGGPPQDCSG